MEFNEQTVLITGAAGNLGRAVAAAFSRQGARLVLLDRSEESLQAAYGEQSEQDDKRLFVAADLLDAAQVQEAVAGVTARGHAIDVLCNVAGGFRMGQPVHETSDQDWNFLFDLNARSVLHMVRAVVPGMIDAGRGKIVSVAANAAHKGMAMMAAYCASKDVVVRMTEAMAAELRDRNINVNCVLPSIIDTPENRAAMPDADFSRWVEPAALADTILFLASDQARAVHGAALPVAGRAG